MVSIRSALKLNDGDIFPVCHSRVGKTSRCDFVASTSDPRVRGGILANHNSTSTCPSVPHLTNPRRKDLGSYPRQSGWSRPELPPSPLSFVDLTYIQHTTHDSCVTRFRIMFWSPSNMTQAAAIGQDASPSKAISSHMENGIPIPPSPHQRQNTLMSSGSTCDDV